ncbi:MAG TPA: hypothetical protein VGQ57_01440, partial [Polyangiaceae bacterium]|nr:hypothetical protein [Polyangiaceae bacterium]
MEPLTTAVPAARALSHKSTLIGIAVPTPTKDGAPIPLADTPPEGFQKQKAPKTDAPPPSTAPVELPPNITPRGQAAVITQEDILAAKAAAQMDPAKLDASTRVTRRDLPIHSSATRASIPPKPAASGSSSSSRYLTLAVALAGLVLAGRFLMRRHDGAPGASTEAPPTAVQLVPQATDKGNAVVPPAGEQAPSLAPPASAPTTDSAPVPSAEPA